MVKLVTFTDHNMTISAKRCAESAVQFGASAYAIWTPAALSPEFCDQAKDILCHERGAGYWVWKPYIILEELKKANEGDIIVYSDSGIEWIAPIKHIIPVGWDLFLFGNGWPHVQWTKGDILRAMLPDALNDQHPVRFQSEYMQVQASVIAIRNTHRSREFVQEWLRGCLVPGFIDDSPSKTPNHPIFVENRHDQSVLSCLSIKYGIPLHWWASTVWQGERWRYPNDRYPALFIHHRKRNNEW